MKLLNYTSRYFVIILLFIIFIWAAFFYYNMLDEIYDSMDDSLENQKGLVLQKVKDNPEILQKKQFEDGYYTIQKLAGKPKKMGKDKYRDTLMFMENEKEFEPVRLLETSFSQAGNYYKLKLITSMVEEDDLVEELLYSIIALYLGLILSILILNNFFLKNTWKPFYSLLEKLKKFSIESEHKITFEDTKIEEFALLNKNIENLLYKSQESYKQQKHFIENASHELQTPIAISINKLELLLEKNNMNEDQIETFSSVLQNLERLKRLNKSLLLLTKIENNQFIEEEDINLNLLLQELLEDFLDYSTYKKVELELIQQKNLRARMNKDLAIILFTNLIQNAIKHGKVGTQIEIIIHKESVMIKNESDHTIPLDVDKIFSRFYKETALQNSTGLGLSIAQAIAKKYGFTVTYTYKDLHCFKVNFQQT
ncbi:HAMP domain-containing sensor histidine kinase [Mesonia sp. MT50]|uniref:histidine kinase n=1 Tax=Mesonia profundi TaxID=3070998 RepID=A0ABU1A1V4_9FLAO|nr:HAMP domain-containing sensor histidine kinase [Mesonia profundi]MDQ7917677.1 HAMP domain-containing sensor histidine kinase [Mesonia profundi]